MEPALAPRRRERRTYHVLRALRKSSAARTSGWSSAGSTPSPTADAGSDQSVNDSDDSGAELRNLDGSGPPRELYLWSSKKTKQGWTEPVRFKAPINTGFETWPSLSRDKTLYFFSRRHGGMGGFDIYRSVPEKGEYGEVQNLGNVINTRYTEEDPFIAPDGSYLLFDSDRPGGYGGYDLYIAWRGKDGAWKLPVNLGAKVNSKDAENRAYVSPDGNYLFFTSDRNGTMDTWWVDAGVFEKLKTLH